jgi:hypothetical protein
MGGLLETRRQEAAAIDLVLQQTEIISEEWAREDLDSKIQAVAADVLTRTSSIQQGDAHQ